MVPEVGLEPTQGCPYQILSLARLPVSPLGLIKEVRFYLERYKKEIKKHESSILSFHERVIISFCLFCLRLLLLLLLIFCLL